MITFRFELTSGWVHSFFIFTFVEQLKGGTFVELVSSAVFFRGTLACLVR